ncbi:NADP-dependent oxidoreductase domain-containing protein [Fusarium redolens]|uniref:NADP-dependent oxidoreductase domain-containing protein n=1 Tax=Fusarium redolens TaxID=48865 RepID=A0A9P9KDT1_FUSRE|nr:NADP-dependent oxidoreductase domain-containing protein [Fusarium redolens]KAH7253676.1 NADP-dependent oxidoreductase domain-containing protein [Fusarium redolens]
MFNLKPSKINIVLGVANVGDGQADPMVRFDKPGEVNALLSTFTKRGYTQIDTARLYPAHAPATCEPKIGLAAKENLVIDTKVNSIQEGGHSKENILKDIDASLKDLKIDQINIEYLHLPDRKTDFKEACEAMNQAHEEGKIKYWGICNHTAQEVETIVKICEKNDLVKPSAYQGQYNPIVRGAEKELIPILRSHGIAFYGYSPAGAGFFAGNHKNVQPGGRFDQSLFLGGLYSGLYLKPAIAEATEKALATASRYGISGHVAALRWSAHHGALSSRFGDSILIGASSLEQLESNIDAIEEGPLPDDVAGALEAIYEEIGDAISYHIVVHNPRPEALRESKRQARSYSAQVAHARARKLRGQGKSQNDAKEKGLEAEIPSTELQGSQGQILNQTLSGYDHETLSTPELRLYQPNLVPYISFLATLTVEECFMFDHYIKVVMPYLDTHCPIARSVGQYHNYIKSNWIVVSSQDLDFMRGFLLVASRHLSMVASKIEFENKALQYKLEYIKKLRQDVSMQPMSMNPRSVTSALVLAYDEVSLLQENSARGYFYGFTTCSWGCEHGSGRWWTPGTGPKPIHILHIVQLCAGRSNWRLGLGFEV